MLLLAACNNAPDLPPYLGDSDGKAPPPPSGGGGGGGDAGRDADAGPPTTLASASNPKAIYLSGGYVYYTNYASGATDGTVSRVGTDGSNPQDVTTGVTAPWAVVVSSGTVFYTTSPTTGTGGVFSVAVSGGAVTPVRQNVIGAVGLALDSAGNVLWTTDTGSGVSVEAAPVGGGAVANVLDFGGALSPDALAVSGVDVFMATDGSQAAVLHGVTNGAGNMEPLDTQITETYGDIALSSTTVYATLGDPSPAGGIVAFPRAGGVATNVTTGLGNPGRLALDGTNLYFTDPQGGAVWVIDVSAPAAPSLVASGLSSPLPIAVADAIYVGASDGIVRIAK
jgi:hypothetical protein